MIMSEIVTYKSDPDIETDARCVLEPALLARGQVLFITGLLVAIAAVIIPIPESFSGLLDFGWILIFCLSAAILMLSMMAKNLSELSGFASFVISITLIRLGIAVASVNSILRYESAGTIIEKTGSLLPMQNLSLYVVVIPVAVFAGVVIIFISTGTVIKKTSQYAADTLTFKYISAEADLNASLISRQQADKIKNKIKTEARFYVSMTTVGKFLRLDAVVNILIVGSAALGIIRSHAEKTVAGSIVADGAIEVSTMLTLGLWAVVFLPAIVLALSSSSVIGKKNIHTDSSPNNDYGNNVNEDAQIDPEDDRFELLNPDFADVAGRIENTRILDITEGFTDNPVENVYSTNEDIDEQGTQGEDMYADIANLVMTECKNGPVTALLCSESVELLPVTTAVKIAVELTERGKKCLLIDADTTRNAVYKVFDIDTIEAAEPFKCCVDGLYVWAVSNDCKTTGADLAEKISAVGSNYDCVIIYAPRIEDSNYYGKLAGFVSVAGFATGDITSEEKYILQFKGLLASVDCKCIVRETLA